MGFTSQFGPGSRLIGLLLVTLSIPGCGAPGSTAGAASAVTPTPAPATAGLEPSAIPRSSPGETSPSPVHSPSSTAPAATASAPTTSASSVTPAPSSGPGGWIRLGRGVLIGIAGDGDALTLGGPPPSLRRYRTDGSLESSIPVPDAFSEFGGAANMTVDPTDDSILLYRPDPGRAIRIDSTTGHVLARYRFPAALYDFAVDGQGRMYLVCLSDRAGCGNTDADYDRLWQFDRSGEVIRKRAMNSGDRCSDGLIMMLGRTRDGGIRTLEYGTKGEFCSDVGAVHAADLDGDLRRVRRSVVPLEKAYLSSTGPDVWSLAGDEARTLLIDKPWKNAAMDRFRLREIERDGTVRAWWGWGSETPGPRNPFVVGLSRDGTIWTVDADPGTNIGEVMLLPPD